MDQPLSSGRELSLTADLQPEAGPPPTPDSEEHHLGGRTLLPTGRNEILRETPCQTHTTFSIVCREASEKKTLINPLIEVGSHLGPLTCQKALTL